CRKQLVIPRWPSIVNDDEDPAGIDTTLWDSPAGAPFASTESVSGYSVDANGDAFAVPVTICVD
ncbi:hypothetical protein, partial [Microbacterium luticocti]|uniref:hypothetical protein n=1 Tax=Microbacterium luticocti TaxID=451764 RepID=UPI001B7F894B